MLVRTCSDDSGKLLAVEVARPETAEGPTCHHVFFDDNIERDRPHIVDVRDVHTGLPIPFSESLNRCVALISKFYRCDRVAM